MWEWVQRVYSGEGPTARVYGYLVLVFDVLMVAYVVVSSFFYGQRTIEVVDGVLGSSSCWISRPAWPSARGAGPS